MEQHPIPQQISSYQFKLVGDMTLKQFFQVAGGVIVSLIFYSTPLHPIIKWPIILFSAGLGAAMAFLPFEERPLERWIIAFFRSIYSPTLFTWKKTEKPPVYYTESAPAPEIKTIANTNPQVEANTAKLEEAEKSFLQKIGGLFSISPQTLVATQQPTTPTVTTPPITVPISFATPQVTAPAVSAQSIAKVPTPLSVPTQIPTVINQQATLITRSAPKLVVEEAAPTNSHQTQAVAIEGQKTEGKEITSNVVEFSVDAAPPSPPIAINTIVGQVMDMDRKIIEGAILEIKDSNGRPVRALKSNRAGHFIIVTPLANGKYEVEIEKEGFKFDPVSFDAKGDMIPPIAIRGTRTA